MQFKRHFKLSAKQQALSLLSTALLILALCSCGSVSVKEEDFYHDVGVNGAVETHLFSTDISYIGEAAWNAMREGMVCESPTAIADMKAEFEKLCSVTACNEETKTVVRAFFARLKEKGIY